jgi:hypothetical protein
MIDGFMATSVGFRLVKSSMQYLNVSKNSGTFRTLGTRVLELRKYLINQPFPTYINHFFIISIPINLSFSLTSQSIILPHNVSTRSRKFLLLQHPFLVRLLLSTESSTSCCSPPIDLRPYAGKQPFSILVELWQQGLVSLPNYKCLGAYGAQQWLAKVTCNLSNWNLMS